MEKLLEVEIVTPQKPIFKGTATSVSLPGELAPFQILYNHAPIFSSLVPGVVSIATESTKQIFAITRGFVSSQENKVVVCVEKAYSKEELDKDKLNTRFAELNLKLKSATSEKEKQEISSLINEVKAQLLALEKD